jgi:hypothetical protein
MSSTMLSTFNLLRMSRFLWQSSPEVLIAVSRISFVQLSVFWRLIYDPVFTTTAQVSLKTCSIKKINSPVDKLFISAIRQEQDMHGERHQTTTTTVVRGDQHA